MFLFIVMLACASMYCVNHWIPAFAGMTLRGLKSGNLSGIVKGLYGW